MRIIYETNQFFYAPQFIIDYRFMHSIIVDRRNLYSRLLCTGLLTHMEHMRMDPKHQFAAQYVLSRAAAERRERDNFLAAVTATNSMGGPASPHSVHSDSSSSNNGEVDGPSGAGSTGSVGTGTNNSVVAAVAAAAAAAAAGGNVIVPTGGRLSVSPADNQIPLVLHHNNNNTTTNNNNNNNNNPTAIKLAELMAARTGGMSKYTFSVRPNAFVFFF